MKKILSLILAVGLLACLFAGCGSDKNKHPPAKPGVFHMRA